MIQFNKHLWGWWASLIYAWIQLGDSIIRVISFGLVSTSWTKDFVQYQGTKLLRTHKEKPR